jgi:hypothetical protein
MSNPTVSMRDALALAWKHVKRNEKLPEIHKICDQVLDYRPFQLDALVIKALACGIERDTDGFAHHKAALDAAYPHFARYDFLRARLERQGKEAGHHFLFEAYKLYREFRQTDNFIVSYPKCGRTWLRAMLIHYLSPEDAARHLELLPYTAADPGLPNTSLTHDDYPHWKSASALVTDKSVYEGKRVLILVRDPRDVLVSSYFQFTKRGDRERARSDFDGPIDEFVFEDVGGVAGLVGFYNAWAPYLDGQNRLLLRYEDLAAAPADVLGDAVRFLGFPQLSRDRLAAAAEFGAFDSMQKMEIDGAFASERLQTADASDREALKVRRGKIGGYRDYLAPDTIARLDAYLAENLDGRYAAYK